MFPLLQHTVLLEIDLTCQYSMEYTPYPQKEGSVGIPIIITNDYEGEDLLPGTQDGTKWQEALEMYKFDDRHSIHSIECLWFDAHCEKISPTLSVARMQL